MVTLIINFNNEINIITHRLMSLHSLLIIYTLSKSTSHIYILIGQNVYLLSVVIQTKTVYQFCGFEQCWHKLSIMFNYISFILCRQTHIVTVVWLRKKSEMNDVFIQMSLHQQQGVSSWCVMLFNDDILLSSEPATTYAETT